MNVEEIQKLVNVRMELLSEFNRRKDWISNRNAIMREIEHIEVLEKAIKQLDLILAQHVTFS